MRLPEYLKKYKLRAAEVARRCGIPYSTFYYAVQGYGVTYKTMIKIIAECDGVKFEDLQPIKKGKTNTRSKKKRLQNNSEAPSILKPSE